MRRAIVALCLCVAACEGTGTTPGTHGRPGAEFIEPSEAQLGSLAPGQVARLRPQEGVSRIAALVILGEVDATPPMLQGRGLGEGDESPWLALSVRWREGRRVVLAVDLPDRGTTAELRAPTGSDSALQLTWSATVPPTTPEVAATEVNARREPLRADIADLGVQSREAWGARPTRCSSQDPGKYRIAIHHTVTSPDGDPAANLRGIQAFHMDGRGWCDIGYHFLVSLDGRVWEGRSVELLGTHVGGQNTGNIGVSFIGCFHSSSCESLPPQMPPDAMVDAGASFVAGIAEIFGITRDPASVKGHRDHDGASTACPGDYLHARLDEVRSGEATRPAYAASYVEQTFPLARDPFELAPNERFMGYIEMRNDGNETWRPGEIFLGTTEPRDAPSPLASESWPSPNRAASIDSEVAPGESGRFVFEVRAPLTPGDYPQFFNLLREGVSWFGDPGQGGPRDDQLQVRVTTLDVPPVPDPTADAAVAMVDAGSNDAGPPDALDSGCTCRVGRSSVPSPMMLGVLAAVVAWRRRRSG